MYSNPETNKPVHSLSNFIPYKSAVLHPFHFTSLDISIVLIKTKMYKI